MPYKKPAQSAEKRMEVWYEHTLAAMDTILGIMDEIEILDARYDLEDGLPTQDESAKLCTDYVTQVKEARAQYVRTQGEFFEVMPSLWQLLGEHNQDELKEQFRQMMQDIRGDLLWFMEKETLMHERLSSLCGRNPEHWSSFQTTVSEELDLLYNNVRHGADYLYSIVGITDAGASAPDA